MLSLHIKITHFKLNFWTESAKNTYFDFFISIKMKSKKKLSEVDKKFVKKLLNMGTKSISKSFLIYLFNL